MLEEFVTLAELSYVRKTNFRVNLMSMAVKNIFLMLADPRCISAAPTARTFLSSPVLGPGGVQKIQGAPLWCCRGCFFLCVALLFTGPGARAYHLESSIIILTAEGNTLYSTIAANISSPIHCPCVDAAAAVIKNIMAALADKGSV